MFSLNIIFQSLLSTELNPESMVSLLKPDPLESCFLFMSVSFFLLCVGFLLTLLTCDSLLEPSTCRQWQCLGLMFPTPNPCEPSVGECDCRNRRAQLLCFWWGQTLKCNFYSWVPIRGQAGAWLCLKPHLCLTAPFSQSSFPRPCLWNPRHAFTDLLLIKKSLRWEQAFFCFTYTFSQSRNSYREWSHLLFQWDHICESSLYTVGAIDTWVIITLMCNGCIYELGKRNLTCKVPITHRTASISHLSITQEVSISISNSLVLLMPCLAANRTALVFSEAQLQDQMGTAPSVRCGAYHVKVIDCTGLARKSVWIFP